MLDWPQCIPYYKKLIIQIPGIDPAGDQIPGIDPAGDQIPGIDPAGDS